VERNRRLAADSLGYALQGSAEYGLRVPGAEKSGYVVLLTMTSRADKLWPDERWIELARELRMPAMLPWGSEEERARAQRIGAATGGTVMPKRLSAQELARLFAAAASVVGLDTGLTHFAAALGTPTVGIYCGSDPALTGLYGAPRARNVGAAGRVPEVREVLQAMT
jgi:heptosyltransferase I